MKKLIEFLTAAGIHYKNTAIGNNYFYDKTLDITRDAVLVSFDFMDYGNNYHAMKAAENNLLRYLKRNKRLAVYNDGFHLGGIWYVIALARDIDETRNYEKYAERAKKSWEIIDHYQRIQGMNLNMNDVARRLMVKYEQQYKQSLLNH